MEDLIKELKASIAAIDKAAKIQKALKPGGAFFVRAVNMKDLIKIAAYIKDMEKGEKLSDRQVAAIYQTILELIADSYPLIHDEAMEMVKILSKNQEDHDECMKEEWDGYV